MNPGTPHKAIGILRNPLKNPPYNVKCCVNPDNNNNNSDSKAGTVRGAK